jgi:hypothetical protein
MTLKTRMRPWSAEDDERLRQHIAQGGSAARATGICKRTEQSVRARAAKLGLKFPTIQQLRSEAAENDDRS